MKILNNEKSDNKILMMTKVKEITIVIISKNKVVLT